MRDQLQIDLSSVNRHWFRSRATCSTLDQHSVELGVLVGPFGRSMVDLRPCILDLGRHGVAILWYSDLESSRFISNALRPADGPRCNLFKALRAIRPPKTTIGIFVCRF